MDKPKVFVFAPADTSGASYRAIESAGFEVVLGDPAWSIPRGSHEPAVIEQARESVAMTGTSLRSTPISRRILEASQRLRIVAKCTVGVDDIDVDAATEMGIMVTHAPTESNCFGVAEHTITMMLAILKKLREKDAAVRAGRWRTDDLQGLHLGRRESDGYPGITIGLVGLGRIGCRVADLLAPWRVRVIACDPYVQPAQFLIHNVKQVDYDTLLRESDVVSLHVVLTKETFHMVSTRELGLMKKNAVLINTARGKIVDETALAAALAAGRIASAAIDAFEEEPLPVDSPLRPLGDKVLFTPHAASFNLDSGLGPGFTWAARSILTALAGGIPDNVYNRDVIPRWKERFGGVRVLGG